MTNVQDMDNDQVVPNTDMCRTVIEEQVADSSSVKKELVAKPEKNPRPEMVRAFKIPRIKRDPSPPKPIEKEEIVVDAPRRAVTPEPDDELVQQQQQQQQQRPHLKRRSADEYPSYFGGGGGGKRFNPSHYSRGPFPRPSNGWSRYRGLFDRRESDDLFDAELLETPAEVFWLNVPPPSSRQPVKSILCLPQVQPRPRKSISWADSSLNRGELTSVLPIPQLNRGVRLPRTSSVAKAPSVDASAAAAAADVVNRGPYSIYRINFPAGWKFREVNSLEKAVQEARESSTLQRFSAPSEEIVPDEPDSDDDDDAFEYAARNDRDDRVLVDETRPAMALPPALANLFHQIEQPEQPPLVYSPPPRSTDPRIIPTPPARRLPLLPTPPISQQRRPPLLADPPTRAFEAEQRRPFRWNPNRRPFRHQTTAPHDQPTQPYSRPYSGFRNNQQQQQQQQRFYHPYQQRRPFRGRFSYPGREGAFSSEPRPQPSYHTYNSSGGRQMDY